MPLLTFIKDLLVATFSQMFALFLGVLIFGTWLNTVSHLTFNSIEKAFRRRGTYVVAWFGTPVHELGHAVFCLIFWHKIVEIRLFQPDPVSGTLGYVSHIWNHRNPWAVLGNVFIAAGPILLGSAVLYLLYYLLIPGAAQAWGDVYAAVQAAGNSASFTAYGAMLWDSAFIVAKSVFSLAELGRWQFWLFFYLSVCVASNMRLSWQDIRGSFSSLALFVALFLLANLIALAAGADLNGLFRFAAPVLGFACSLLVMAALMASLGFVVVYLISAAYARIARGEGLNPL